MQMVLKCADIGHLAADPITHKRWAFQLEEEFFRQVYHLSVFVCLDCFCLFACVCLMNLSHGRQSICMKAWLRICLHTRLCICSIAWQSVCLSPAMYLPVCLSACLFCLPCLFVGSTESLVGATHFASLHALLQAPTGQHPPLYIGLSSLNFNIAASGMCAIRLQDDLAIC